MSIKRLDHISVVVDDLAAAIAFFTGSKASWSTS
jgi:catechol 2,3-dioxygenase-like lactoylglutathione lyase family enzyme